MKFMVYFVLFFLFALLTISDAKEGERKRDWLKNHFKRGQGTRNNGTGGVGVFNPGRK